MLLDEEHANQIARNREARVLAILQDSGLRAALDTLASAGIEPSLVHGAYREVYRSKMADLLGSLDDETKRQADGIIGRIKGDSDP